MSFHVLSVVTTIVNYARTHTSSIGAYMVTYIEADNRAFNTCTKKHRMFVALDDALCNHKITLVSVAHAIFTWEFGAKFADLYMNNIR